MDLQLSKDGEVVLFHDDNLKRVTGLDRTISALDKEQIQAISYTVSNKLNHCELQLRIPLLQQVLTEFSHARLVLDIHSANPAIVTQLIALIEDHAMDSQVVIVSQFEHIISSFKKHRPYLRYGATASEVKRMVFSSYIYLDTLFPITSDILMIPVHYDRYRMLTKRVISHVKQRNKKLWLWIYEGRSESSSKQVETIETVKQYQMLQHLGVDGVFTTCPEKLLSARSNWKEGAP